MSGLETTESQRSIRIRSFRMAMLMLRRGLKYAAGATGLALAGTAGATAYKYNTDPGVKRTLDFTYSIVPMGFDYACEAAKSSFNMGSSSNSSASADAKAKEEDEQEKEKEARMQALHREYAPKLLQSVLKMKGYYIKAAQMMCGSGLLPKAYDDEFKVLLDSVPPRDSDVIEEIVRSELGVDNIEDVFETFEEKPIGRYIDRTGVVAWYLWHRYNQNAKPEMQSLCIDQTTPRSHIPRIQCAS